MNEIKLLNELMFCLMTALNQGSQQEIDDVKLELDLILFKYGIFVFIKNRQIETWLPVSYTKTYISLSYSSTVIYEYDVSTSKARMIKSREDKISNDWFCYTGDRVELGKIVNVKA